ncbi:kinesin-like protein KIN-7O isoform X2 [Macadamia integrifolia]|uniref:kinesin-like protein KIN-7O isoform X2 n=1 Tax=Macadamia integrifolia TaxID=60698 RepID=UPI001C4F3508|nr:kinesin-like protein KIN-7O isoform X2 [Macadamia integrifolia]
MEKSERIYVTVRSRPLSPEDAKASPWRISGKSISLANQSTKFEFDQIFGEECKTALVYEARTRDIVAAAVRGFNGTVFAYGQTNSGKTHTMRGSATEPGVIPLAVHDLFQIIEEDVDREFLLRMSYMEIYNEEINDLLAPEHRKLQIHESIERGIFVAGLREEIVASPEQVLDFMEFGESHRHIGETNMNVYSSRSHTIFRMIIESKEKSDDGDIGTSCDAVRVSVLNLVDLAGSERAAKTGAEGVRLKEGSHINKSLMTLGTVIKKLSEGAESQGGHVPYRDSKLTRILQPALGGNANTAIICNITLAQVHSDETKSSLQFASRALRVTNCARVNEILTDAALLKRQKKEIEGLRAKLQESHSEHLEEEVLNLRNTLLKSELERERIALELQQEKEAQAQRERRLQEQDKKIENLRSMVFYSNREEKFGHYKKDKRRDTWCPGALSREALKEESSEAQSRASVMKTTRAQRDMGLPIPFEELIKESEVTTFPQDTCRTDKTCSNDSAEDCAVPDARALLHVTNRRKLPLKKKSSTVESSELAEMQVEYEALLLKFETQRTTKDLEIDCLAKKLTDALCYSNGENTDSSSCKLSASTFGGDRNLTLRESEAIIVIKQLQEQIKTLEVEKSTIQKNLDSVVELATEQNISAKDKYDELLNAREEAGVAHEEALIRMIEEDNAAHSIGLSMAIQGIQLEIQNSIDVAASISSVMDELFKSVSVVPNLFLDLRSFFCEGSVQLKSIMVNHENIHNYMRKKVAELENEKMNHHKQIEELGLDLQNSEKDLMEHCRKEELEKAELLSQIQNLEKEVACLSSCSLAREKENLRRELEKTKMKLKETESKLKNAIQEKTRLEGEKAYAEREIKLLHGQKTLLERDICKRDSLAGRRRDSVADRRRESKAFDSNRAKVHNSPYEQLQEEYKKLEVLAFEMETTIASLEEELEAANREKAEAIIRNEVLTSELEAMSCKLESSNLELKMSQEEVLSIQLNLSESETMCHKMDSSLNMVLGEKEELAMQLANALLELEEEKAIWAAKERASIEAIAEKTKLTNDEIIKELSKTRYELEVFREECKVLREKLMLSEENIELHSKSSMEKSFEIEQLKNDFKAFEIKSTICHNDLNDQLLNMTDERDTLLAGKEEQLAHMLEMEILKKSNDDMLLKAKVDLDEMTEHLCTLEVKMQNERMNNGKESAKLRMRLRATQAKLDACRGRHKEAVDEMGFMNRRFEEASAKLKGQLTSYGLEVLQLKKLLAVKGQ